MPAILVGRPARNLSVLYLGVQPFFNELLRSLLRPIGSGVPGGSAARGLPFRPISRSSTAGLINAARVLRPGPGRNGLLVLV